MAVLAGSPFRDYFLPGLVLLVVLGIGSSFVSLAAARDGLTSAIKTIFFVWFVDFDLLLRVGVLGD